MNLVFIFFLLLLPLRVFPHSSKTASDPRPKAEDSTILYQTGHDANVITNLLAGTLGTNSACAMPKKDVQPFFNSICAELDKYPNSNIPPHSFQSGIEFKLCSMHWGNPPDDIALKKVSYRSLDYCGDPKMDRYSTDYKPLSRDQMKEKGYEYASKDKMKKFIEDLEKVKSQAATNCCGENQQCKTAMLNVEIFSCESQEADADSNIPDPCSDGAYFTLSDLENYKLWKKMREFYIKDQQIPEEYRDEAKQHEVSFWENLSESFTTINIDPHGSFLDDFFRKPPQWPYPGRLILSRYVKRSTKTSDKAQWFDDSKIAMHELAHACSNVWSQLMSNPDLNPKKAAEARIMLSPEDMEDYCRVDSFDLTTYTDLFSKIGSGPKLTSCLVDVAAQSRVEGPLKTCPTSCPQSYLEESLAEVAWWKKWKDDVYPTVYPSWACFGGRDSYHPHSQDILECMVQNDQPFLNKFKSRFKCGAN